MHSRSLCYIKAYFLCKTYNKIIINEPIMVFSTFISLVSKLFENHPAKQSIWDYLVPTVCWHTRCLPSAYCMLAYPGAQWHTWSDGFLSSIISNTSDTTYLPKLPHLPLSATCPICHQFCPGLVSAGWVGLINNNCPGSLDTYMVVNWCSELASVTGG